MWLLLVGRALACEGAYTVDALLSDLVAAEDALRAGATAAAEVARMEAGLGCLDVVIPGVIVGRTWRAVASAHLDDGRMEAWLRTAADVDGSYLYGVEEMEARHPLRLAWNAVRESAGAPRVAAADLLPGEQWLNGRRLDPTRVRPNAMHLYQRQTVDGMRGAVIEGASFPDWARAPAAAAPVAKPERTARAPKEAPAEREEAPRREPRQQTEVASPAKGGPVVLERKRPWEKTPLIAGGAAIVGGSGLLYWASSLERDRFDDARTLDDATSARNATNALVLGAVGALAVGGGTLTWGVVLADGAGPVLGWRF